MSLSKARDTAPMLRDFDLWALLAIALALPFELNIIGRLFVSDLISAALLPFLAVTRWQYVASRVSYRVIGLGLLWFISAVITDLVRDTPFEDLSRGWARIFFLLINLVVIQSLVRNRLSYVSVFIFFCTVSSVLRLAFGVGGVDFGGEVFGTAWRFGYGFLFAQICILFAIYVRTRGLPSSLALAAPFVASGLALATNSRNLFGITLLAAVINAANRSGRRLALDKLAIYSAAALAVSFGSIGLYTYAASTGMLGNEAQVKYEVQATNKLGLLAGRGEFLASSAAIKDSPIIGHGSWARDIRYVELLVAKLEDTGVVTQGDPYISDLIPSHSHIFGSWVEAGIAGAFFWIYILGITCLALLRSVIRQSPMTPFISLICLQFLWDIFFSPFGLDRRVSEAGWISLMLVVTKLHTSAAQQGLGRPTSWRKSAVET